MIYHSQNQEAKIVAEYFGDFKGTLLDVGANDGITFSNSYDLIQSGWGGYLLEPGDVFNKLFTIHKDVKDVHRYNFGIGEKTETKKMYQSGSHVPEGKDSGLVSSINYDETIRWRNSGVEFSEINIQLVSFNDFHKEYVKKDLDFISIDTEGNDWIVLQQIDLTSVVCKCICIEWNRDAYLFGLYAEYVERFGMKEIYRSAENLIFAL